jgi:hypothetical protein
MGHVDKVESEDETTINRTIVLSTIAISLLGSAALWAQAPQGPVPLPTCATCEVSFFIADNPAG